MALFNRQMIHWKLQENDLVGFSRSPFSEHQIDAIFRVLSVSDDSCYMSIEVILAHSIAIGTIYENQPIAGFKKVKLTPLDASLTYTFVD